MKVSDFKLEKVRKEFVVEINGELEKVTVYNILNEEREEIRLQLEDIIEGKTEHTLDAEDIEDIYNILFPVCTNIEVDENIIGALNNPNKDMILVLNEVREILDEIYLEVLLNQSQQLTELEKGLILKRNLLKGEKIELLTKDCEKLKKEIEEIKKVGEKMEEIMNEVLMQETGYDKRIPNMYERSGDFKNIVTSEQVSHMEIDGVFQDNGGWVDKHGVHYFPLNRWEEGTVWAPGYRDDNPVYYPATNVVDNSKTAIDVMIPTELKERLLARGLRVV